MKQSLIAPLILATCLLPLTSFGQEMKTSSMTEGATSTYRNRLPNNYGKLGLSDEQRERIYGIQAQYRVRIADLLDELEELRNQQTLEIQEVLTPNQKDELQVILKEAQARRASRRRASE